MKYSSESSRARNRSSGATEVMVFFSSVRLLATISTEELKKHVTHTPRSTATVQRRIFFQSVCRTELLTGKYAVISSRGHTHKRMDVRCACVVLLTCVRSRASCLLCLLTTYVRRLKSIKTTIEYFQLRNLLQENFNFTIQIYCTNSPRGISLHQHLPCHVWQHVRPVSSHRKTHRHIFRTETASPTSAHVACGA